MSISELYEKGQREAAEAQAEAERWADEQGMTHWSDGTPRANAQADASDSSNKSEWTPKRVEDMTPAEKAYFFKELSMGRNPNLEDVGSLANAEANSGNDLSQSEWTPKSVADMTPEEREYFANELRMGRNPNLQPDPQAGHSGGGSMGSGGSGDPGGPGNSAGPDPDPNIDPELRADVERVNKELYEKFFSLKDQQDSAFMSTIEATNQADAYRFANHQKDLGEKINEVRREIWKNQQRLKK